jgi:Protein of unknown function (DUF3102)
MTALAVSLASLADAANIEHRAFEATASAAVAHAVAAGEALAKAKAQLPHGDWLPWLRANVDFSERTARRYMTIAANRTRVADMDSVCGALSALAGPRPASSAYREEMAELSRAFDRMMANRPTRLGGGGGARYVPQGKDPHWRLEEALAAATRVADHVKALGELGEKPPNMRGRKREVRGVLRELRKAADQIEAQLIGNGDSTSDATR